MKFSELMAQLNTQMEVGAAPPPILPSELAEEPDIPATAPQPPSPALVYANPPPTLQQVVARVVRQPVSSQPKARNWLDEYFSKFTVLPGDIEDSPWDYIELPERPAAPTVDDELRAANALLLDRLRKYFRDEPGATDAVFYKIKFAVCLEYNLPPLRPGQERPSFLDDMEAGIPVPLDFAACINDIELSQIGMTGARILCQRLILQAGDVELHRRLVFGD